ncbi:uncharacterized protein I303_102321 [Kwoniella dejecticola CBS 10117]|uniref:Uncharacterized protein n=1 Tax=Kwoniella dejecticola CBS 10117 TaxID=1296121 RepID=A0A1A6AB94_9TREE|nr:uncharacterized protein I303_01538 [Kwoniella dejecticola CBS 10117]OBR87336.1 hypothetical protein I303_01538 [Kwoniella dejecticola CBS 10117]
MIQRTIPQYNPEANMDTDQFVQGCRRHLVCGPEHCAATSKNELKSTKSNRTTRNATGPERKLLDVTSTPSLSVPIVGLPVVGAVLPLINPAQSSLATLAAPALPSPVDLNLERRPIRSAADQSLNQYQEKSSAPAAWDLPAADQTYDMYGNIYPGSDQASADQPTWGVPWAGSQMAGVYDNVGPDMQPSNWTVDWDNYHGDPRPYDDAQL